jgi:hypothetical protein
METSRPCEFGEFEEERERGEKEERNIENKQRV